MGAFEEFESYVREGLAHLYDPTYQPAELIWEVTGCNPQQGVESVQAALIQAIEGLKPASDIPPNARIRRFYELLSCRYVQELTQVQTARRLNITPRHLRREQQLAIHILAQRLWEQRPLERSSVDNPLKNNVQPAEATGPDAPSTAWRSQVKQELVSLQQHAPGAVADVGATIQGTVKIGLALASKHNLNLSAGPGQPNLMAAIHPSLLSQILITAIEKLVQCMSSGEITLGAERDGEHIKITITGNPTMTDSLPQSDLIREILSEQNGSVEAFRVDDHLIFQITLPSADSIKVLVVDDNQDLVHWYRRYTAQTRYQIVHLAEGQHLFETIAASSPDLIVLDVMLPDIDGWELLTHLREHPDTRSIPVIVCSVVKRKELALALGAAVYLPKPVHRRQFIQALDQVSARASRTEANIAIAG